MTQTINIAQVTAASGTMVDIEIDKIVLGGVTIGQVVLNGTSLDIASGSAFLQNVRIVLTLDFFFNWSVNIWFWSDSGSINLGSLSFPLDLGNVLVPSLNHIPLNIPNIVLANLSAIVAPLTSVDLGGGSFTGLTATKIAIPKNGFTLTGLGLGSVSVSTVQVPQTAVAKVSVQDFHPNANIVLPSATLGPVQIPSGNVSNIQTTAPIGFNGIASQQGIGFGFGPVSASIMVTPTAFVSIGSLLLQGVSLSGSVAQAILANIGVPVDIRGINVSTIDIGQLDVNNITL
jgi:hypothetical protein